VTNKEKQAFNKKTQRDNPEVGMSRQDFKIVILTMFKDLEENMDICVNRWKNLTIEKIKKTNSTAAK